MSGDTDAYLAMERAVYADLVRRSSFQDEDFVASDTRELVVGSYAQHEHFDYERWLFGGIDVGSDATALEYGCGPGRMLLRLAPMFRRVDGIDISREVLDVARQRSRGLDNPPRLVLTDGQEVPVDAASYDLAYSVICLQHICVYTVRKAILQGLFRALKPGGILTFQMGYGPGHAARVDYFTDYLAAKGTNGVVDVTVLHPAELAIDLAEVGFEYSWFSLTPTGPGDTHGAWIFVRAVKPGGSAAVGWSERKWRDAAFAPAEPDVEAMKRARSIQIERGLMKRSRQEEGMIAALRARLAEQTRASALERESLNSEIDELERRLQKRSA